MIEMLAYLICDQCGGRAGPKFHTVPVSRADQEAVRSEAQTKRGWKRYRKENTSALGDHCPLCHAAHQSEQQAKPRVRRGNRPVKGAAR